MKGKGKTVRIFLVDGTPNGVLTSEIMNWTGKITVAPRSQLPDLSKRPEIKKTGVYILVGESPDNPLETMVYIGESDSVWKRLTQHAQDAEKDFWQRTVIITSKDENLTKSHVRYLESRLIELVNHAGRAKLRNGTAPETPQLPEPDIADMEYFLEQVEMLLPVLGFSFALPLPEISGEDVQEGNAKSPVFELTYAGARALAVERNDEFIVIKGSTARQKHTKSLAEPYLQIRGRLVEDGRLVDSDKDGYWVFTQDVPFRSPSTAANIVGGASLNGRVVWKIKGTKKTYAEWQNEQLEMVAAANHAFT